METQLADTVAASSSTVMVSPVQRAMSSAVNHLAKLAEQTRTTKSIPTVPDS